MVVEMGSSRRIETGLQLKTRSLCRERILVTANQRSK